MATAIVIGRIIDGTGREPFVGEIHLQGDRIVAVTEGRSESLPPGAEVYDAGNKTILPGLIDAHVHLYGFKSMSGSLSRLTEPLLLRAFRTVPSCAALLDSGFTTVRDMGGRIALYLRRAIEEGTIRGPRIVSSYRQLSPLSGGSDLGFIPPEAVEEFYHARICNGMDDCRTAAREEIRKGVDFVKIYSTGEVSMRPAFTQAEIEAIVSEARTAGKYVAAHAYGGTGLLNAVRAGARTIEHGSLIDDECIEAMLQYGVYLVPTMSIFRALLGVSDVNAPVSGEAAELMAGAAARLVPGVRDAHRAGVKIALGTDVGVSPDTLPFGTSGREMLLLQEAGFTPMEAILAATNTASQAIGLGSQIGTLVKGKFADLIAVDGDPLKDLTCLADAAKVKMVMKGGNIVKLIAQ